MVAQLSNVVYDTIYGKIAVGDYFQGGVCCNMHTTVEEMLGDGVVIGDKIGTHPALVAASHGNKDCHATEKTLKADRVFLGHALNMSIVGFAYLHDGGLPAVRKWGTGVMCGMSVFGRGYCYLAYIRPEFRMRVARILGPLPRLSLFCALFRLAGVSSTYHHPYGVSEGIVHCDHTRVEKKMSGVDLMKTFLGLLSLDPDMRIGVNLSELRADVPLEVVTEQPKKKKEFCAECGFMVVPEGHAGRCQRKRLKDPAAELIGDAWHALDVKLMLVDHMPVGTQYTELAKQFMSATAQRCYLESLDPGACPEGSSDHSWGSEFEARYKGNFRLVYKDWLFLQLHPDSRCYCRKRSGWGELRGEQLAPESGSWFVSTVSKVSHLLG